MKNILRKKGFILLTAAVFLLGGFFVFNTAHAATINVPGDQPTIQAAVGASTDGDTINVAAGTYAENVAINNKTNLTIQGVGDTTIIEPVSGIGFAVTSSTNLTIKNLKIHTTGTNAHGIWVAGAGSGGSAMSGLTVQGTTIVVDGYSAGIYAEEVNPAHSGWLIGGSGIGQGNTLTINSGTGVTGDGLDLHDVSASEVSYNTITLNNPTNSTNVLWTSELSNLSSLVFSHNTVSGSSGSEIAFVTDFITAVDTTISTVTVSNNTFSNWGSRALRLGGSITGATVNSNTFQMSSDTTEVIGGTAAPSATGTGNTFNVSSSAKIQKAISSALAGDTINVAAGTYTETGQIVVSKNLSIVGENKLTTIIKPAQNTGNTGTSKGWLLVNSGITFNLSNVTLNGEGYEIYHAIQHQGSGTINNVKFINIKYEASGPAYQGAGVRVVGTGNVDVTNSEFSQMGRYGVQIYWDSAPTGTYSGNTYTGKGLGNWLDYAFEIGGGAHITLSNNTISGNRGVATSDGSDSAAISVWDDPDTQATINDNTLTDNHIGVAVAVFSGSSVYPLVTIGTGNVFTGNDIAIDVQSIGALGSPTVNITGSTFTNNTTGLAVVAGMTASNISVHTSSFTGGTVDVANSGTGSINTESNYWGSLSPDFGSIVSGNVTYDPWCLDSGCTNSSSTIATIFDGVATTLTGQGVVSNIGNVTASNFTSFSGLYFEKAGLGKITFSSALDLSSSETQTFLQNLGTKMEQTSGHIKFDARTSTVFAATGATLEMYNMPLGILESQIVVRDDTGAIISPVGIVGGFGQVGSTVSFTAAHFTQFDVDNTPPTGTIVINGGASYTNNQNVTLTLSASDNLSGVTQMEVYKNTTPQGVEPYSTTRLLTLTSGDATKTVKVKFFDAAGNVSSLFTTTIILDTVAPVITLNGDATLNIEYRGTYTEPGATADDGSTVVIGGSVNTSVLGTYTVTYNATDLAGNTAAQVTRTVNVVPKPATVTANSKSKTYGEADPDFTFTSEGLVGGDSLADVVCSVSGVHVNAGTYPIVCSGNTNSNYSVTYNDSTLTINRRPITVTAVSFTKTIDGTSHTTATPITDNLADGDTPIFSESYDNGNVGVNKTLTPGILIRNSSNFIVTSNYEITLVSVNTGVILALTQSTPDETGDVTINSTKPEVVITNPTQAVDVTISSGTVDPKIDVSAFITAGTGTLPAITVTSVDAGNATVAIPASTVVTSADNTWDGVIAAPTVTTVTLPVITGQILTPSAAVEVGFSGAKLSFDQAVRLLLPGQAGKRAGYVRTGIAFTEITNTCTGDDQTSGNALGVDGDCKIDVGSDMVIWTKHFTSFASYTQVVRNSGGGGGFMTPTIFSVALATPVGQVLGTSTEPIPGCGNRTTGFSVVSGQSCATNLVGQILGAEKFVFTKLMKKGSRGDEVKELQKFLTAQGYNVGKIDGIFGAKVRAAVIQFQLAKKLKGDGIVGPKLRDFINK